MTTVVNYGSAGVNERAFELRLPAHLVGVLLYLLSRLGPRSFRDCIIKNLCQVRDALLQQALLIEKILPYLTGAPADAAQGGRES